MRLSEAQRQELEALRLNEGGVLRPKSIIAFAKDPETELHKQFEWDDKKAGDKYRLQQAREMIRVVVVVEEGGGVPHRMYVSLSTDRGENGPYRAIHDVVRDEKSYRVMLADAMDELDKFRKKYERLTELQDVMSAITRARRQFTGAVVEATVL